MKCKRETDGRKHGRGALPVMRQQVVKAVRSGQDVQSVANAYGVNIRSVFRWLAEFANGGQNALRFKQIPGRPSKVTPQEMRWLDNAINMLILYRTPKPFDEDIIHPSALAIHTDLEHRRLHRCLGGGVAPGRIQADSSPANLRIVGVFLLNVAVRGGL
jgi:hypothetical protein